MGAQLHTRLPTGTVTFLFTDVAGSIRLLTELGDAHPPLLEVHAGILRSAISAHDGIEVSTDGNSFFAVFASAHEAVRAAGDAQRKLAEHDWGETEVRVPMGLHNSDGRFGSSSSRGCRRNSQRPGRLTPGRTTCRSRQPRWSDVSTSWGLRERNLLLVLDGSSGVFGLWR